MSILISGPVDISILRYNGIKIILLSDEHFSSEGICEDPNHYTASGLIDKIIVQVEQKGQYVDVYLEAPPPIIRAKQIEHEAQYKRQKAQQPGLKRPMISFYKHSLGQTIIHYSNCLYDKTCPYATARIHYIDNRPPLEGKQLLHMIQQFLVDLLFTNTPDTFIRRDDTLRLHIDFFIYAFIINTFLVTPHDEFSNTGKFIDSNLWRYYDIMINSDDFTADVESYLDNLLTTDTKYINNTSDLLAYLYPGYSANAIKVMINSELDAMFALIRRTLLASPHVTQRTDGTVRKRTMHKIRAQLLGLELQGDYERAQSLRQFMYDKFSLFDLSPSIEMFEQYDKARILYIINNDETVFSFFNNTDHSLIGAITDYLSIDSLTTDLYALARMFRTYPNQFRTSNKSTTYHVPSSYIIEYAGSYHIDTVVEYFASVGAQREYFAITKEGERCLRVPSGIFD